MKAMNSYKEIQTALEREKVYGAEINVVRDGREVFIKVKNGDVYREHWGVKKAMRELGFELFNVEAFNGNGTIYDAIYNFVPCI